MPSKLSIVVSNHTATTLSLFNPVQYSIVEGAISSPPRTVEANRKGVGGVFTFDEKLCAMSVYESPDPKYVWILFVQASKGQDPIVKTVFYPATTTINSALVNDIRNSSAPGNTAMQNVSAGPTAAESSLKATCRVWAPEDTELDEGLTVEFKLTVTAIVIAVNESISPLPISARKLKKLGLVSKRASTASPANGSRGAVLASKLSILISNHTATTLSLFNPVQSSIVDGVISSPPQVIEANRKGTGGVFAFDTNLCAISVYESPDPKYVWILFVQASKGRDPIVKTVFYSATARIDPTLVKNIMNDSAFGNTAEHSVSDGRMTYQFKATCRIWAPEDTERDEGLTVEFKLTVTEMITSVNASLPRPPIVVRESDSYEPSIMSDQVSRATVASETRGAAMSSKLSILVSNHTTTTLSLIHPVNYSVVEGAISSPPQNVEANRKGAGGVFTFDTKLCAISVYESPDPKQVWILFVQASKGKNPIVKTVFYPAKTRINSALVNEIRNSSAFGNSATHNGSSGQMSYQSTLKATCLVWAAEETERDEGITVEFKLIVTGIVAAANPSKSPAPPLVREPEEFRVESKPASTATRANASYGAAMPSKLSIVVSNHTAKTLSLFSPVQYLIVDGAVSSPPQSVKPNRKDAGGVFAFDTKLCAISVYETRDLEYVWILFVQASKGNDPIVKTIFCPSSTILNSAFVKNIKRNSTFGETAEHSVLVGQITYQSKATCRILAPEESEPEHGLIVEFKLTETALQVVAVGNPSKNTSWRPIPVSEPDSDDHSVLSVRVPAATLARETNRAVVPSKLSVTVLNRTAQDLHPVTPTQFATSDGVNSTPPQAVASDSKGAGGVYDFSTDLCAISVYESHDPKYIWILFVQSSKGEDPIVKTVFVPATTGIDAVLVNDIRHTAAYEDTATHAFTIAGLNVTLHAECWAVGRLSVEFKIKATAENPKSTTLGPPPPMARPYAYDEGGYDYGRDQPNRAPRGDARQRDRDAFREHARRGAW